MKRETAQSVRYFVLLLLTLVLLPAAAFCASALPPAPARDIYLVDDAAMVTPEDRQAILETGRALNQKTGAQVVVVTMNTLGGEDLEDYTNRLFRSWGIGNRKKNNGVLLLIAKEDRKFRIETGYGLESTITDGYAGTVLDSMKQDFRNENYSAAILSAYRKLAERAYVAEGSEVPEDLRQIVSEEEEDPLWVLVAAGIIAVVLIVLFLLYLWQMVKSLIHILSSGRFFDDDFSGSGSRYHDDSWGGGSSGGSSDGGDSFGGGDSGGGGSSDSW